MSQWITYIIDNLAYIAIPFISGLVGWGTNVLALKMTFYPLEYIGIRPFGWQGIVPSKAKKMATTSVDLMADKLINVKEVFSKLDPDKISDLLSDGTEKLSVKIVNEVMTAQAARAWVLLPKSVKEKIYAEIKAEIPRVTSEFMADIKEDIRDLLDLKALAVDVLVNDKALINRIFLEVGKKEFKFIERSGFYFGFLFGIIQMIIFVYYDPWWMLPVAGIFVGYMTNYLALKMIFRPVKSYNILGYKLQGLFFKRQKEVAEAYSKIVTDKILTIENLFDFIMRGADTTKITALIYKHIGGMIDRIGESYKNLVHIIGEKRLSVVKNITVYRFKEEILTEIPAIYKYSEKAINLNKTMCEKMTALSAPEFEGFLHPVFQEDELKLILVGAFLGGLAGLAQYFIMFY